MTHKVLPIGIDDFEKLITKPRAGLNRAGRLRA